jgi:ATP-dependent Clp protease ATP-binding subunit ClpB
MPHLLRGDDVLARKPDFKLTGRDADLRRLSSILMRKSASSVVMVGPGGVGCSALCLGLQAMKSDPNAPFDIVSKRFFWLDVDALFSTGEGQEINVSFQKMLSQLTRVQNSVLIIDDVRDFMEACQSSGNRHFVNALVNAVKSSKTQMILEVRDEDLGALYRWHSGFRDSFSLMDVQEPKREFLPEIIAEIAKGVSKHHGIRIEDEAIDEAVSLTSKYRGDVRGLKSAQPDRTIGLLDRALGTYRLAAHEKPPHIAALEADAVRIGGDKILELSAAIRDWDIKQSRIKSLYAEQRDGERVIMSIDDQLHEAEQQRLQRVVSAPGDTSAINAFAGRGGADNEHQIELNKKRNVIVAELDRLRGEYEAAVTDANALFSLGRADVIAEFAKISGIDAGKLGENDLAVLRRLEENLKASIFGQDHILLQVSNGIKVAKIGKRNGRKPLASYMFLGPSGVGKTAVAEQVASSLGMELLRLDMSEYMEKHAVARLIGAPPGYEGFEAGGILTNAVRRNRQLVILFDEIEKAHPDVFNVLLQVLDAGRLTDNVGRVCEFEETIIVMTSNIGQEHFLNQDISFAEARDLANVELEATYRNEFLNRFNGRQNIVSFNRLELASIERIVRREVSELSRTYEPRGLEIVLDDAALAAFCLDHYDPKMGARGLPGYIQTHLEPIIVNHIIETPEDIGALLVAYSTDVKSFDVVFNRSDVTHA